jgi:hypothetical protein
MGVDIHLESVWKPFEEKYVLPPVDRALSIIDDFRASGGYFRNGYNRGDVMAAMLIGWRQVAQMLDDRGYLPVDCAGELVGEIEKRPLSREHVVKHVVGDHLYEGGTPPTEKETDDLVTFLNMRRDELLAILRKSIELNEPLHCSL